MAAVLWIILPGLVAAGSALLTFYIMHARQEMTLALERESALEARVRLESHRRTMEEAIKATEESVRRKALDEFLGDVRVEERHYVREHKALFRSRKTVVLQERLFFRNIPLSNWVERELVVEEAGNVSRMIRDASIFGPRPLAGNEPAPAARLLE